MAAVPTDMSSFAQPIGARPMGSDSMLEEFLLGIEMLPSEMRRGLALMRKLDDSTDNWQLKSSQLETELLKRAYALAAKHDSGKKSSSVSSSLSKLADGTDPTLKEILSLFDRSICNADEKLQVSFQLSDLMECHFESLRSSIGKVNSGVNVGRDSRFSPGATVAAQIFDDTSDTAEPSYILGHIVRFDPENDLWIIADADTEETTEHHSVTEDQITELLDLPFSELPKYKKGDEIMALYPQTTTFYKAEVQMPPKRGGGGQEHYLLVHFHNDYTADGIPVQLTVNPQFVFRTLEQRVGK